MNDSESIWALYDALIEGIPPEYPVDQALEGVYWTMVRSGASCGLAMTLAKNPQEGTRPRTLPASCRGMPLRELASAAKSWNFAEASLGVAAINAYWNNPAHGELAKALQGKNFSAFEVWQDRVAGKKVAVIGHFPHLERTLGKVCDLSILEKRPLPGDYPDSACEFLLPLQDYVFATGVTLINKTLPRLLELSRRQGLILVGPSVPLAPLLFDWGVRDLQGMVVTDPERCRGVITGENPGSTVFDAGQRVSIERN